MQARRFGDMVWVDGEHQLSAAGRGRVLGLLCCQGLVLRGMQHPQQEGPELYMLYFSC